MKRHAALQDLSRDHHHLLLLCREIGWLARGSPRAAPSGEVSAALLEHWQAEGTLHLQEEEELLLPLLQDHDAEAYATRMLAEHRWLREEVAGLARLPAPEPAQLAEIGTRLHDHVRWEERVLFPHLQQRLSDEVLARLGAASRTFREQHRPHAIGPRG